METLDFITSTFITDTSLKEINIPIQMKKETLAAASTAKKTGKINLTLFDHSQLHVYQMMNTDVLPGFKKQVIVNIQLNLAVADAIWWKKNITFKEFFSFPNPSIK